MQRTQCSTKTDKSKSGSATATTGTANDVDETSYSRSRTIEEIYQKKNPVEHILARPDTYVGSTTALEDTKQLVVAHDAENGKTRIERRNLQNYVPALFRIIDELLVNAIDNFNRPRTGTNKIKVDVDQSTGWIRVYNNGKSVPVAVHKKEKIYVPELVFGHLLTGSNFDDQEVKFTGGRNGYGAKLANIFAREFVVEIADTKHKKRYRQTWFENMTQCSDAEISPWDAAKQQSAGDGEDANYIRASLLPDFSRFLMTNGKPIQGLSDDFFRMLERRVYDIAACNKGMSMYWNGSRIVLHSFIDYVRLFFQNKKAPSKNQQRQEEESENDDDDEGEETEIDDTSFVYKRINKQWEIAVGPAIESLDGGQSTGRVAQFSFVNSISTRQGGTHVTHVMTQLTRMIIEYIKKNHKELHLNIQPSHVASQMSLFINCRIENPEFDSQTKETLTTRHTQFSKFAEIPDSFIKEIAENTTIIDDIISMSLFKAKRQHLQVSNAGRSKRKALNVPKLHDANWAGTARSQECTLIITEGDSAKALAIAGLSVIGRDKYGVFPLKGKMLNVRDATMEQVEKNAEVQNLKKILGLRMNIDYKPPFSGLRYGKVMLMCDQDHDGSHIKGLFLNMIQYFFPSLLKHNYVEEFITPIVKVSHSRTKQSRSFFTIPEYEAWRDGLKTNALSEWKIKYYKGLGTSTATEAKQYFSELDKHRIKFTCQGEKDFQLMDMIFSKQRANERKTWLVEYNEGVHIDHSSGTIPLNDFINKELILFSQYDNVRSIPSLMDGLKLSQRKVLFGCFKRRLRQEVKVVQLAGYVSEQSAYHHGEQSLHSTIVAMAQDFCGSNNIPLLYPSGQFGTRLQGGKDAASARYIFTRLNKVTRLIYMEDDDPILDYRTDDGIKIEPRFYMPIIPMVLVNGAEGMGTGWSTSIPCFNPLDIIDNLLTMLKKCDQDHTAMLDKLECDTPTESPFTPNELHKLLKPMNVWYRNFKGKLTESDGSTGHVHRVVSVGVVQMDRKRSTITITELPVGKWTEDYKEFLVELVNGVGNNSNSPTSDTKRKSSANKNTKPTTRTKRINDLVIRSFTEHHTEDKVRFDLQLSKEAFQNVMEQEEKGTLFRMLKLETYIPLSNMTLFDSSNILRQYDSAVDILNEFFRVRLVYYAKRKSHLLAQQKYDLALLKNKRQFLSLIAEGKIRMHTQKKVEITEQLKRHGIQGMNQLGKANGVDMSSRHTDYDYLMNLPMHQLSNDNLERMDKQLEQKRENLTALERQTPSDMWRQDLLHLASTISNPDMYVQ